MSESEVVKMAVVLVPVIWTVVVFLAGWIVEEVRNYIGTGICSKTRTQ